MFAWLADNTATILICAGLIAVVMCIIVKMVKDKKAGKTSCGNNCTHCAMACKCHSNVYNKKA